MKKVYERLEICIWHTKDIIMESVPDMDFIIGDDGKEDIF